jgi:hypothetical protein
MAARVICTSASVGSIRCASGTSSTRTSPAPYMIVARILTLRCQNGQNNLVHVASTLRTTDDGPACRLASAPAPALVEKMGVSMGPKAIGYIRVSRVGGREGD